MKADPKKEAAVMNVVKQWFEAFANGDIDSVLAFVAPDPDVVVIGTGKDDKCIGLAKLRTAAERAFAETKGTSVKMGWHMVSAVGSLAWVAADVTFQGKTSKGEIYLPLRYTGVLEWRGNRWLIVQSHDSLPTTG
jgi:ketosteroid isomerase-like protein